MGPTSRQTGLRAGGRVWVSAMVMLTVLAGLSVTGMAWWRRAPPLPAYLTAHYRDSLQYHLRGDALVPAGRWLLFGDSLIEGLPAAALHVPAVNYGIGHDNVRGISARLPSYDSLDSAAAVVIGAGTNDLALGRSPSNIAADYATLLSRVPSGPQVICLAVLPIDPTGHRRLIGREPARVRALNDLLETLCSEEGRRWVAVPDAMFGADDSLAQHLHVGDGLHLGPAGYAVWLLSLNAALDSPR